MRSVSADPTYQPEQYQNDQNDPYHTAESGVPIATVSI
jgi:hypothetical protein